MTEKEYFDSKEPDFYQKVGNVWARPATVNEKIITVINEVVETKNTAKFGDIVVLGSSDEEYIVKKDTFYSRYELLEQVAMFNGKIYQKAKAIGTVWATEYKGEPIAFQASWGETMICEDGDYLASTERNGSIYRIERNAFFKTYVPAGLSETGILEG